MTDETNLDIMNHMIMRYNNSESAVIFFDVKYRKIKLLCDISMQDIKEIFQNKNLFIFVKGLEKFNAQETVHITLSQLINTYLGYFLLKGGCNDWNRKEKRVR